MVRWLAIGILAMSSTVLSFPRDTSSATPTDTAQFQGELFKEIKNDTLHVRYHLTPHNFKPDSVILTVWGYSNIIKFDVNSFNDTLNHVAIYHKSEGIPLENNWRTVINRDGKLYLDGRIRIPIDGQSIIGWECAATGYYTDSAGELQQMSTYEYLSPWYFGLGMEIWFPSFGYFKSEFDKPLDKEGLFLGYGLSCEYGSSRGGFSISTSWSGLGKNFAFSEPFRVGYRYYTGTRHNFMPSFCAAVKLSKIKLRKDDIEFRKHNWGVEGGVALEGPFERLGYHYSPGAGGYHTIELFLAASSGYTAKLGTRYLFQKADEVWMIRISFHAEGWTQLAGAKGFMRENNRPLPHKILAFAGFLPAAVIAAPFWVAWKLFG